MSMSEFSVFRRGLLIGFSIAAPVGPIRVLCIRRTRAKGRLAGFLSGMGAASMMLGVFLGSATWWLTISFMVGLLRQHFNPTWQPG
jgi:threonine/homoserine/homoserine lactone efflux protein